MRNLPVLIIKHEAFPLKPGDRSSRGPTAPLRIEKVPEHSIAALPDLTLPYPRMDTWKLRMHDIPTGALR